MSSVSEILIPVRRLSNAARASISDELLMDFKNFLIQRGLRVRRQDSRETPARARDFVRRPPTPPAPRGVARLNGLAGLWNIVGRVEPELETNAMLCAVNQAADLPRRQVPQQSRDFL